MNWNLPFTEQQLKALRRTAKKHNKDFGGGYSAALDQVAANYGFRNWSLLMKAQNAHEQVRDRVRGPD